MLLVNNPGSWSEVYPPLLHAPWHGWTFTDLIFPFFLWIVGVAMTISFARRMERGDDRRRLFRHVVTRSAIIFAIGLFLAAFPFGLLPAHHFSLATLRIPGVLQRIAVCYLVASGITLGTGWRGQAGWIVGLLASYWLLVTLVPVPSYGAGVLEPTGSLAWYLDSTLLAGHTWSGAPVPGFDPEGILSTIPAVATTLFGVLTGRLLRSSLSSEAKTAWMFIGGEALLALGLAMNHWLPINKNLWTSSYAVFMAGCAMVVFATCYWLIDVKGYRRWAHPFVVYGMNALAIFALSGIVAKLLYLVRWNTADGATVTLKGFIYEGVFTPIASPVNASLLFAIAFVLAGYLAAEWMWRRGWFVRI